MNSQTAILEKNAEMLKSIGHPIRLCIIKKLFESGGCTITHMQTCMNASQSSLSQHVRTLKSCGIVKGTRQGKEIVYQLIREDIADIIKIIFNERGQDNE
ncbi:MAG: winged helix-turn-helix transcriptional regulator [Clostridia bacterium]|nr:winged helix-turn-helix transcriptional regulator [Clostridia bacterium]